MSIEEFKVLEKALHDLTDAINQKFEMKQQETLQKVAEMFAQRDQQCASTSDGWHEFSKIERYLEALVRVSAAGGHKVHDEMDEAVKKLRKLAYE